MAQITPFALLLLFAVVIFAFRFGPRTADGSRALVSAYNVFIILFFLYVVFSAALSVVFNGNRFTWATSVSDPAYMLVALIVCLYAFITFIIGYGPRKIAQHPFTKISPPASASGIRRQRYVAYALVIVGIALKVYVVWHLGGLSSSLVRLSGGVRQSLRLEAVEPFIINLRTLSGVADAGAVWILLTSMRRRSGYMVATAVFCAVILFTYVTIGKRLFLAWPLLSAAVGYHFWVRRITLRAAPWVVIGVLLLGLISLFFRIFLPASIANVGIDLRNVMWAQGSLLSFYFYSLEFSTFEMITLSIIEPNRITDLFGGAFDAFITTNIVPFFYTIPRILWAAKPEVFLDLSHGINSIISGTALDTTTIGVAATLIGNSWLIAGFPGLTIAMFIFGRLCNRIDRPLRFQRNMEIGDIVIFSFYLNVVIHAFRQGTLGWIFMITVVQQYGLLIGYAIIVVFGARTSAAGYLLPRRVISQARNKRAWYIAMSTRARNGFVSERLDD